MQRQNLIEEGVEKRTVNHHVVIQSVMITTKEIEFSEVVARAVRCSVRKTAMEECLGSGFILKSITSFSIVFLAQKIVHLLGCYVPFPLRVRGKCAIFNPSAKDNGCLLRCLVSFKLRKLKLPFSKLTLLLPLLKEEKEEEDKEDRKTTRCSPSMAKMK